MAAILIKTLLISGLLLIFYQDHKERAVWWFLFPVFAATAGYLHYTQNLGSLFLIHIGFNMAALLSVFFFAFLYAQLKMKVHFFREAFGTGDLLFFLGLTIAFPTESFIVLLVFSMIFALALHLVLSRRSPQTTVPLAGYASLFLVIIYLSNWTGYYKNLYIIG